MRCDRSPGSFAWVPDERWGPLKGKLITCSYGMGRLFLVLHENTEGKRQGGVVPLPLEFETGVMRARFRKSDGQLYVCGLYGWSGDKKYPGGFYRVRFTGKNLYLPRELRVAADGVLIRFTVPLHAATALDRDSYSVSRWNYKWTSRYGSDEYRLNGEKGRDPAAVDQILLSRDRTTVFLKIRDFKPVMQMRIQMKLKAADGMWFASEVHHTVHARGASSGRELIQADTAATLGER